MTPRLSARKIHDSKNGENVLLDQASKLYRHSRQDISTAYHIQRGNPVCSHCGHEGAAIATNPVLCILSGNHRLVTQIYR